MRLPLARMIKVSVPIARQDFLDWFGDDVFARVYSKLKEFSAMGWIMLGDDWFGWYQIVGAWYWMKSLAIWTLIEFLGRNLNRLKLDCCKIPIMFSL